MILQLHKRYVVSLIISIYFAFQRKSQCIIDFFFFNVIQNIKKFQKKKKKKKQKKILYSIQSSRLRFELRFVKSRY